MSSGGTGLARRGANVDYMGCSDVLTIFLSFCLAAEKCQGYVSRNVGLWRQSCLKKVLLSVEKSG